MKDGDALWRSIYELYCLLSSRENYEKKYQDYFEKHPVVFSVLGVDRAEPFEKGSSNKLPYDTDNNFNPEPDFIGIDSSSGTLSIIELKTPFVGSITTSRPDKQRSKFKAISEGYISQATEYVDSIREQSAAKSVIKKVFAIKKITAYRIVLVYGLAKNNDEGLISTLCSKRNIQTEIVFYDKFLDKLIDQYSISRKDTLSRAGWCFGFHIIIPQKQIYQRAYIGDYGYGSRNRLSVVIEGNSLTFDCRDSNGDCHRLSSPLFVGGPQYIRFEFSNDSNGIYMSLNVNNIEQDLRVGKNILNFSPDISLFTMGANSKGKNGACFTMLEQYTFDRTLSIREKLEIYSYFVQKTQNATKGVVFNGKGYMSTAKKAKMNQDERKE